MSKSFIQRESNALVPGTPLVNANQIYLSAEKNGYYQERSNG